MLLANGKKQIKTENSPNSHESANSDRAATIPFLYFRPLIQVEWQFFPAPKSPTRQVTAGTKPRAGDERRPQNLPPAPSCNISVSQREIRHKQGAPLKDQEAGWA